MSDLLQPGQLFNPLTAPPTAPLTPWEILASPFGLVAFLALVPLVRLVARYRRRAALIGGGLLWLVGTLGPMATTIFVGGVLAGGAWVVGLAMLRRRGRIGAGAMIACVWLGLHVLVLPVWWFPSADWYGWRPSRLPLLHNIGFAYYLLRFIAWGHQLARRPEQPLRLTETLGWILYPPCMRLGPLLLRDAFLERFDAWNPAARTEWRLVLRRLGQFLLGMVALGMVVSNTPRTVPGGPSFFAAPENYSTDKLLLVLYLIPIQIYLLLWSYNELAAGLAAWVGIRVDDNFNWLPVATSVREFWRRWHVTVGAWLRNHIYIPLGGNCGTVWLHYLAVFAYVGVWHGPSWSFSAWAWAQALALIVQLQWDRLRARLGWAWRPSGPAWTLVCWLLTMHYALVTIVVFTDIEHLGVRLFAELLARIS